MFIYRKVIFEFEMASRTHIQEYESEIILQKFMVEENILINFGKILDFGIDGELLIFQEERSEDFYKEVEAVEPDLSKMVLFQLKSRRNKSGINKDGTVSYSFEKQHLEMWKNSQTPVFVFLVYLDEPKEIYWKYVDIDLKIKEGKSKTQSLKLEKLEKGCRNRFNKVIEEHYKQKGYKYNVSTKLPMFIDFIERRKQGLELRESLIFTKLNPVVDKEAKMLSPFPKSGLRSEVSYSEYAISIDDFYKNPDDAYINESSIYKSRTERNIESVYSTEATKIIYDLVNNRETFFDDSWIEIFENISKITEEYTRPILFINSKLKNNIDEYTRPILTINSNNIRIQRIPTADIPSLVNQVLYNSKADAISHSHSEDIINGKNIYFYFFDIPRHLSKKFPVLNDIKIIILDREKVKYIVKEPLRLEWRTITRPVQVDIIDGAAYKVTKKEEEWDWFDFTCYTVGEIRNEGSIKIYKFSEDEKKELQDFEDRLIKLTKSRKITKE